MTKNKRRIITVIWLTIVIFHASKSAFAAPSLSFYAFNAGYKDDVDSQNYDFIELQAASELPIDLSNTKIVYTNSAGTRAGEISFPPQTMLEKSHLVLGFAKNPQYEDCSDSGLTYYFSDSGLASTAGKLELFDGEQLLDELCWGKIACSSNAVKFATKIEDNYSAVRNDVGFEYQKYYPEIDRNAISTPPPAPPVCDALRFTEVLSYYDASAEEQFIELQNISDQEITLSSCSLQFKKVTFQLSGTLAPQAYYVFRDQNLSLTKNPSSSAEILLLENNQLVGSLKYPHGQRKNTSYALFDDNNWSLTYAPTPGAENIYQEYQNCPEGKIINEQTGNCVKIAELDSETTCPEGKYLNILTGRCKKIEESETTECKTGYYRNPETGRCKKLTTEKTTSDCAEGYERNPETNRCRKIRISSEMSYAPEADAVLPESYENPKVFVGAGILIVLTIVSIVYTILQFRKEIKKFLRRIFRRKAKTQKHGP